MTWVLWDILIPLITVFVLGVLFGWLEWGWRRHGSYNRTATTAGALDGITFGSDVSSSAVSEADAEAEDLDASNQLTSTAVQLADIPSLKELEAANITLIGERDEAMLSLEDLQSETQLLKDRIAELEADQTDASDDEIASESAVPAVGLTDALTDDGEAEAIELQRLQSRCADLDDTLDKERKARRATELELLNIKNRHDKLTEDVTSRISAEQHVQELTERDEKIEALTQQLSDQSAVQTEAGVSVASIVLTDATQQKPGPEENTVSKSTDSGNMESDDPEPACSHDAEMNTQPIATAQLDSNSDLKEQQAFATDDEYVPEGWSVPKKPPLPEEHDKLTAIKGVGGVLEKKLHECGIYFYRQLAGLDEQGMEELQSRIPQFPGRIQRDRWVEQAIELQQKKSVQ